MSGSRTQKSGKIVVVGDGACGKTCLLEVFKKNHFPETYIPTVVDNFVKEVKVGEDRYVSLALWDTAGQEDYDTIRPLSYKETDLVLLCYTIENKRKLGNIKSKWMTELKNYCSDSTFFLVGLKKDVRDKDDPLVNQGNLVSEEDGRKLAGEIQAIKFFECSALTGENVDAVFTEVAKHIWDTKASPTGEEGSCSFMFKMCNCYSR
jgi:Ras homolog gene family, member A